MPSSPKIPKEVILENALHVLQRDGYENVNIKAVAKEIGCSTQPISWHFGNMDGLRRELSEYAHKVALEKIANSPSDSYDLIYMDIQMPELNGYETTEALRNGEKEEYHRIPIIAMTANVFDEDVEKCRKAGMNAHIGKPIDPSQLAYVTNQVLSNKNGDGFSEIVGGGVLRL